jgi:S1-C subfamily serine protease
LSEIDTSPTKTVGNYLGLVASAEKTKEGGFAILDVAPGGLSEFAGIKKGDILIKVDTYSVKDFDIERVAAYVEQRTKQKAVVKATVLRDGQSIIIEMQL